MLTKKKMIYFIPNQTIPNTELGEEIDNGKSILIETAKIAKVDTCLNLK